MKSNLYLLCIAILCLHSVPAFAAPVTYTNGEIYNAPNVNTDDYDSVNFVITDSSLHSYPRNLSGSGIVNYTGNSVNYYLNLTGNNSAFSGTFNVTNAGTNTSLYFSAASASIPTATLVMGDLTYVRTKVGSDTTIQIGALSGTGIVRNDESSGHTITYQLGGANTDATFSGQIMNTWRSDVNNYPVAISKVGSGTQTFAGSNTYTGTTTISEGTLRLIGSGTLGSATSDVTVTSPAANKWATLEFAKASGTIDFNRNIASLWYSAAATGGQNTGRIIKSGAATLNFTGGITSTGFETTAGVTNFGTSSAANANSLRLGYLSADNATVNYYGDPAGSMTILAGGESYVGSAGNATFNIHSGTVGTETTDANKNYLKLNIGGKTNADNSSVGTVNISSGATYNAGKQIVNVGSWGKGFLNIYGTMTASAMLDIAQHSGGSEGTLTVYDGGSLTSSGVIRIGSYGTGLLTVKGGGVVNANGETIIGSYGVGSLVIENGGRYISTKNMKLAEHTDLSGTLTVEKGGYLESLDLQVGAWGNGVVNNYGEIVATSTVKIGRDGLAGSGVVNVYEGATLSAGEVYPGVTMPGTLNIDGGTVTANSVAMHGRGANATGTVTITNGGSLTADSILFGFVNERTYAVDTVLTLDDGTLTVRNLSYPRNGAQANNVIPTVNLGEGTIIASSTNNVWDAEIDVNLTSADGTTIQVDNGRILTINGAITGSGSINKTGDGVLKLAGVNSYTGNTTISAGTLNLLENGTLYNLSGGSLNDDGTIATAATLNAADKDVTLNNSETTKFVGAMTAASINKTGNGTLQVYTGEQSTITTDNFTVSAGELDFKGNFEGNFEVINGAVFSPGNSIGTANINGSILFTNDDAASNGFALFEFGEYTGEDENHDLIVLGNDSIFTGDDAAILLSFANDDAQDWAAEGSEYKLVSNGTFNDGADYSSWLGSNTDLFGLTGKSDGLYLVALSSPDPGAGVPEPSTWALLVFGVVVLFLRRRVRS